MSKKAENCAGCGNKLSFFTKPNFGGGKLSDGKRVCRNCFKTLVKFDIGFGLNSKREYDTEKVIKILSGKNPPKIKTSDVVSTSSKSSGKNQTDLTSQINLNNLQAYVEQQEEERQKEIKNFSYNPIQIQRQGLQLLESLNIIDNSKNFDTIQSRFEFIEKFYDELLKASFNKRYINDVQIAVDEYKSMYYDKILKDFELALLVQPSEEKLSSFYGESLMKCFNRFLKEQQNQIEKLKRQDAIDKRWSKILDIARKFTYELGTKGKKTPNYNEYKNEIERVRQQTYNKRHKNVG